jgi:predicted NBD/HSP70 family sugar kinase
MCYVLFDIGGSKTRVGFTHDLVTIDSIQSFATPRTAKVGVEKIIKAVQAYTDEPIRAVSGGIRGTLGADKQTLVHDAVLVAWQDEPVADLLGKALKSKVLLENDTALAGLGEVHYGAGKGYEIVVYHTVSTGVGGVKIEDGVIDDNAAGFEPGHQILDIDHSILGEGVPPTLENLVSGSALTERLGVPPQELAQSDAIWDQLAYYLAHGLRNTVLYWSPDVIILGGPMIVGNPRIPLESIIKHTNEVLEEVTQTPLILEATLGDSAGLYGAMHRLQSEI